MSDHTDAPFRVGTLSPRLCNKSNLNCFVPLSTDMTSFSELLVVTGRLLNRTNLEVQNGPLDLVVVLGAGVGDLGGGHVELGLTDLDDGTAAHRVAGLRQIKGQTGVLEELLGQVEF